MTTSSNLTNYQSSYAYNTNTTNTTKPYDNTKDNRVLWTLFSNKNKFSVNETILVTGMVKSIYAPIINHPVTIEVRQNNLTIYKTSVMTNHEGKYNSAFRIPINGVITISAKLPEEKPELGALITVIIANPTIVDAWTILWISIVIIISVIVLIKKIKVR